MVKMFKQEAPTFILENGFNPSMERYILEDQLPTSAEFINFDSETLLMLEQDETMDIETQVKQQVAQFIPVSPRGPPERAAFAGELDFQVEINASDTHKRKFLYSNQLNRIYVDMRCNFSVQFRWRGGPRPMYVRAGVVFSDEAQAEKRVERCTQHTHETGNDNIGLEVVKNVLHSARERNTHGVYYCGAPELPDSWYSVLVQFPSGGGVHSHAYQFVCKNSCSNGINRRAIAIIFSLEDDTGYVYGRQTVGARVCACPRRDMLRDEEAEGAKAGKRRAHGTTPTTTATTTPTATPRPKKVKVEVPVGDASDDAPVMLPQIPVLGSRVAIAGLEVMVRMMEQSADVLREAPPAAEYRRHAAALRAHIDTMRAARPQ